MPVTRADLPIALPHKNQRSHAGARQRPPGVWAALAAIAGFVGSSLAVWSPLALTSCKSPESTTPPSQAASGQAASGQSQSGTTTSTSADDLDRTMVIGPTAARTLGYRVDWEARDVIPAGRSVRMMQPDGDALFVLDSSNDLARVRSTDGLRIWQSPIGSPVDNVLGINRVTFPNDRVFVTVEGAMFVLDTGNGALLARNRLSRVANTAPIEVGRFLIYGGRTGEIVWQEFRVGHPWRVNAVDGSIRHKPVFAEDATGGDIVAASNAGVVITMDARTARTIWSKPLLAGVSSRPAAGGGLAFVAGEDQYLWALRLADGSTAWKYFNDAPLTTGPMLLGDRVYQRIPSEGLVAFDAFQSDRPDGRKVWVNKEVRGEVIGRKGRDLIVWDRSTRTLSLLDDRGFAAQSVALPQVDQLLLSAEENGELYASAADGRVVKLVPQ